MNTQLNKYGLVELNTNELAKINGGIPWAKLYKWGKRVVNAIEAANILEEIQDGYQKCNNV